jgi:hypothetical protein
MSGLKSHYGCALTVENKGDDLRKMVEEWPEPSFGSMASARVGTRLSYSFEGIFVGQEDFRTDEPTRAYPESI